MESIYRISSYRFPTEGFLAVNLICWRRRVQNQRKHRDCRKGE